MIPERGVSAGSTRAIPSMCIMIPERGVSGEALRVTREGGAMTPERGDSECRSSSTTPGHTDTDRTDTGHTDAHCGSTSTNVSLWKREHQHRCPRFHSIQVSSVFRFPLYSDGGLEVGAHSPAPAGTHNPGTRRRTHHQHTQRPRNSPFRGLEKRARESALFQNMVNACPG